MDKRLIINADDFGLSEAVNKGIIEAHTQGVLTSATIMTNMPAAQQAVELAKQWPDLGIGVHLNLTNGKPVCRNDSVKILLNNEGDFGLSEGKLAIASIITGKVRAAIEAELSAQIQWLIDHGIRPTHLDSHKHIHTWPLIFRIVCRLAKRFAIPAVRYAYEPKQVCYLPWPFTDHEGRKKASRVRSMAKINRLQNRKFFKTDALFGVAHVGKINTTFLRAVALYNQVPNSELMTHPGYTHDLNSNQTSLLKQRELEVDALCSEKTKQCFKEAGIKLIHYGLL